MISGRLAAAAGRRSATIHFGHSSAVVKTLMARKCADTTGWTTSRSCEWSNSKTVCTHPTVENELWEEARAAIGGGYAYWSGEMRGDGVKDSLHAAELELALKFPWAA